MPVSLDIWQVLGSTTPYVIGSMATQPHTSWVKGIPFRKYGTPCRVTFPLSHNLIRNLKNINKTLSYVSLMFITSSTVLHRRWLERWKLDDLLHLVFFYHCHLERGIEWGEHLVPFSVAKGYASYIQYTTKKLLDIPFVLDIRAMQILFNFDGLSNAMKVLKSTLRYSHAQLLYI